MMLPTRRRIFGWALAVSVAANGASALAAVEPLAARAAAVAREGVSVFATGTVGLLVEAADFSDQELTRIVAAIPDLQTVSIEKGKISAIGLAALRQLRNLESLGIKVSVDDAGIQALQGIATLKRLEISVPRVEPAAPIGTPPPAPRITDKAFANAKSWPNLEVFTVNVADFLSEEPQAVFSRVKKRNYGTALTDVTLRNLAQCRKLKRVELYSALVTDAGVKPLLGLPELNELTLSDCKGITDASAPTFGRMKLRVLVLTGTSYTEKGTATLLRLMPKTMLSDAEGEFHKPP